MYSRKLPAQSVIEVGEIRFVKGKRNVLALEIFQNHPQLAVNGYIGHCEGEEGQRKIL